ncbi:hypothetical protein [Olivibacter sitiensis]|uniref:hypothetical protein n=1 Tax=Olivibacter sitiensis TaxID=376470 RepID=UPI000484404E|nr:hypothetical protein [Olivibacter sitiensis]
MKKLIFPFFACLVMTVCLSTEVKAQAMGDDYNNAIGGRFGIANGITFKHFFKQDQALDVILNFRSKRNDYSRFKLVGLYQWHLPISDVAGLRWYYGVGGGLGSYTDKVADESELDFSVDGVIGLDYKIPNAPINLSLDWKPALNFSPDTGLDAEGIGLSIRFAF